MKRVLITGGTRGIGKAMAVDFAKADYEVHIVGRNKEQGQKVIDELENINPKGIHKLFIVDLESIEENKKFVCEYKSLYKQLDLLILNANIRPRKIADLTNEGYNNIFMVGCISRYLFIKEFEDILLTSKEGKIVHIGDARLLQKINEKNLKVDGISGMKSLLSAYTGSAYFNYFLNDREIIKVPSIFVNPGMVDTNNEQGEKSSFWIRMISKKPEVVSKRIVDNIIMISSNESAKKFYNIDKLCSLDKKISKKENNFNKLYEIVQNIITVNHIN